MNHPVPGSFARRFLVAALGFVVGATAEATTYYWDTNGAAAGIGSATSPVSWLTNSWAASSSGTAATDPWPNTQPTNDDEAVFMGTAGTANVGTDVYVNALSFQTHNYTIASTGGTLRLVGADPTITVNLPSNNNTATISAPILGDNGFRLAGNSLTGGLKFLVLANANAAAPNAFAGTLTIDAGGALRLGGGAAREQIPDDVDMTVFGVIDFITSGGASDGKQEKVRNVAVSGANANFSVGNESNFVVNSITGASTSGAGIALNGNNGAAPNAPGKLSITGWSDGSADLILQDGRVRLNTTSATGAVGSRVLLSRNINSSGASLVTNVNGGGGNVNTNNFTNKAFDFVSTAHAINVIDGTLTFTSAATNHPLQVTSTNVGGTTLTKTGAGIWLWEHAVQSSFTGVNRIEEGIWRIGASERLADTSQLEVAGGVFDLQGFSETVGGVYLASGSITGTGVAMLISASDSQVESGTIEVRLGGDFDLIKSTAGAVTLEGANNYTGNTIVQAGTLSITNPTLSLADTADVILSAEATFNLNFSGTDDIRSLYFDGISQAAGTWGSLTSSATNKSPFFAGAGILQVLTFVAPFIGDYNNNGVVDAADYVVYRDSIGAAGLMNRDPDNAGPVGPADLASWRAHFGLTAPGSGSSLNNAAVPEPASLLLVVIASLAGIGVSRRCR